LFRSHFRTSETRLVGEEEEEAATAAGAIWATVEGMILWKAQTGSSMMGDFLSVVGWGEMLFVVVVVRVVVGSAQ